MQTLPKRTAPAARPAVMMEGLEERQLLFNPAFMEAAGHLSVWGTAGNDTITIGRDPANTANVRVTVNAKTFKFPLAWIKSVKVQAGAGNDRIEVDGSKGPINNAPMQLLGQAGNDTIITGLGNCSLLGGGEPDVLFGRAGNNTLNGGLANDRIFAGTGNDVLIGEGGRDYISDAGGKNTISADPLMDFVVKAPLPSVVPTATSALPVPPLSAGGPAPLPTQDFPANPFVIGVWSQPAWSFDKWQARGINTAVGYESLGGTVSVEQFNAAAYANGLYMIRHANADPTKDKGVKNLLAWMLDDEPDFHNTPASKLQDQYKKLKAADASRPVMVNFSGSSALWGYGGKKAADYQAWMKAADWVSNDLYPMNAHNRPTALDAPGKASALLSAWSGGKRQLAVIEASDQQLPGKEHAYTGPTPDQLRAEVFNAVISGATGIVYFPQQIGDGFNFDATTPAIQKEMMTINARLGRIGNALMTQVNPAGVSATVGGSLRATWRKYNGKTYLVVLNNSTATVTNAKVSLKGITATAAAVDGENRAVKIAGNQITDTFKPYEAHVYVVG